mgnify:CR=1 FL=1
MFGSRLCLYSFPQGCDKYKMNSNLDKIALDLYGKIETRFPNIKIGDENATVLSKKQDIPKARFFEFEYKDEGVSMGNVSITSLGMIGKSKGWFLPISVHPICFGIGQITKKPVVVDDQIVIREILNLTVLVDHDVIDGARMARFMGELTEKLEGGEGLS